MTMVTTCLMFEGNAEEAMNFYVSLFDQGNVESIERYGEEDDGPTGKVEVARFTLNGQRFMCIDSAVEHDFSFTPALSMQIGCDTEAELDNLYAKLSEGGSVLMPLDSYPFSERFAWVEDRFGVSWQLMLPKA